MARLALPQNLPNAPLLDVFIDATPNPHARTPHTTGGSGDAFLENDNRKRSNGTRSDWTTEADGAGLSPPSWPCKQNVSNAFRVWLGHRGAHLHAKQAAFASIGADERKRNAHSVGGPCYRTTTWWRFSHTRVEENKSPASPGCYNIVYLPQPSLRYAIYTAGP